MFVVYDDKFSKVCFEDCNMAKKLHHSFENNSIARLRGNTFKGIYDDLKKYNLLPVKLEPTIPKINEKSRELRNLGNEKFKTKSYDLALHEYNESVKTAELDSQDYAFALANRSAALLYLKEYDACINDVQRALAANYPKELAYKLYEREVKCLKQMGKILEAKLKFKEFLSHLTYSGLTDDKKEAIKKQIVLFLSQTSQKTGAATKHKVKLLGRPSARIPSLSKFVELKYSKLMGRHLVASKNILPGDVLAIEKPYAGILKQDFSRYNCHNCFKICLSNIPCKKCSWVIYCNEDCREQSFENGHKYECNIYATFKDWPGMEPVHHLSLCIFFKAVCELGLDNYVAFVGASNAYHTSTADNTTQTMKGFNNNGKYLSNQFIPAYTLEGNETKRSVDDLFIRYYHAAILVSFIRLAGLKISDDQLDTVGESLVHILCVCYCNAHGMTQFPECKMWSLYNGLNTNVENVSFSSLLLPVLSLLNHSCDPNIEKFNYNGSIVVRAIQHISKDSQLFDHYGKWYAANTKKERKLLLSGQYYFHCKCKPCNENWPLFPILPNASKCKLKTGVNFQVLVKGTKKFHDFINKIKSKNINGFKRLKFFYTYLRLLHMSVKEPCLEYVMCQEAIKEICFTTVDKYVVKAD